jgi:hypothetical protein
MNSQKDICKEYGAEYVPCDLGQLSGVAANVVPVAIVR